jgi:hypothetical protein
MILILSLLAVMLLGALGSALLMTTMVETQIAVAYRRGAEALYAADGAGEYAIQELATISDWTSVLDGTAVSTFVDGPPAGTRPLPGGGAIDLGTVTNVVRCGKTTACSAADMNASTSDRPWGADNPHWQLFGYGRFDLLPAGSPIGSSTYVVVWAGDDPAEHDHRPLVDGDTNVDGTANRGKDVVVLLAYAYGEAGARRAVEMTVARVAGGAIRLVAWRDVRQ